MAIYSLNLGFISRSVGRSAVGFSAYISGGQQQDLRTGVSYDYGCKEDVIMNRILAPESAPEWAKNSSTLWNRVEQFEDDIGALRFRGDSSDPEKNQKSLEAREQFLSSTQTAQTIMGAIPIEFTQFEAEACVEEFLLDRFVSRDLVVEYALHWDKGNPHFHGQLTRRPLVNGDFSQRKDQEIVSKTELYVTRKLWETVVNKHLELGDHEVRIDSRSHEDRGSLFLPTAHEGCYAQQLAERGQYSRIVGDNEAVCKKNIEILYQNPAALIQEVASKRTTFTRRHIEEEIVRRVGGDAKLFSLLKARVEGLDIPSELILNQENDDIVFEGGQVRNLAAQLTDRLLGDKEVSSEVGENINREQIFTPAAYKKQEEHVVDLADTLHQRSTKEVSEEVVWRAIEKGEAELGNSFSEEQRAAISHLCSGPDIRLLNGKAGTGKTTLLKAVAQAYQEVGYQVMGTTFQGKAVEIMEQEVGIPCKTLDSFLHAWDKHQRQKDLVESGKLWGRPYLYAFNRMQALEQHRLTSNNVILVDEANM
ncbi:MAG: MobA/MobL family protein, partial [Alphaproteobacteria bacterium]|nr:MobA/MobL family protein [Alphaproteobacteria bacterium]